MATASVRSELSCPLCREIYTDPVTLPCGHNYCRVCIGRTWDWQEGIEEDPSCPECRKTYRRRPELNRNLRLHSVAERFRPTDPEQECSGIFCTYCDSPVPAAKSCLHCEASLCDYHVREHSRAAEHVLTDPTASFGHRKCSEHKKILEFYCPEDGACVCVSCRLEGDHVGHRVEPLSEASEKKKEKLREVLVELRPEREETEGQIQRLQERLREVPGKAAGNTERVTALFRDIREQLEALEKQLLRDISWEQKKVSLRLNDWIHQLEIKKDELSRKIRHIEELCNMADPLTVLQAPEPHGAEFHVPEICLEPFMKNIFQRKATISGQDTPGQQERDAIRIPVLQAQDSDTDTSDNDGSDNKNRGIYSLFTHLMPYGYLGRAFKKKVPAVGDLDVDRISKTLLSGLADIVTWVRWRGTRTLVERSAAPKYNSLFPYSAHTNDRAGSNESNSSTSENEYWDMVGCYTGRGSAEDRESSS
uniref:Uncharacterized protein n=1 Tax=Xenopus tropicalis TaxID=8364 RepID=A0A803JRX3_XENTR